MPRSLIQDPKPRKGNLILFNIDRKGRVNIAFYMEIRVRESDLPGDKSYLE